MKSGPADPAIKLFGRTIPSEMRAARGDSGDGAQILEVQMANNAPSEEEEDTPSSLDDLGSSSGSCEDDKAAEADRKEQQQARKADNSNNTNFNNNNNNDNLKKSPSAVTIHPKQQPSPSPDEKPVLKRPDKLVPCPRCNSMETKFCYFNNYNVNQPRHFCKNCQRYWTAGGTLRNVPVGAGRRKSKHNHPSTGSHHHHQPHHHQHHQEQMKNEKLNMSQKVAAGRTRLPPILPQEICHFTSAPPETSSSGSSILTSLNSSNSTIFSMHLAAAAAAAAVASSQAPGEASVNVSPSSRKEWLVVPESSTETTTTITTTKTENQTETEVAKECSVNGGVNANVPPGWPCFPWTAPQQQSSEFMSSEMAGWLSGVWAAGLPAWAPLAAASLWGPAGPWAAAATAAAAAIAAAASANCSPPFSKVLGKHPRDKLECGRVEGCLWAPKTLRIDDPGEAAKSSIWQTLGLDKVPSAAAAAAAPGGGGGGGSSGVYKLFQSKGGVEAKGGHGQSQKVHANPAALSRSLGFQENS